MAGVKLPKGYKPKKSETYMSAKQLEYFPYFWHASVAAVRAARGTSPSLKVEAR